MGYEFFEEKIIFPSTPVPGINNDQSLKRNKGERKKLILEHCFSYIVSHNQINVYNLRLFRGSFKKLENS